MPTADIEYVSSGNARFANKLYNILSRSEGNLFFSPLSAHAVLAMAYQGAAKETAKQFASTLNVPDHKIAANGYNAVMNYLNKIDGVTLHIANKIFVMDRFILKTEFEKAATQLFLSETQSVNFSENVETADKINKWVEDKTNSKIKDLISPDSLDCDTRLVLVNAIYFKGDWEHKFRKEYTTMEPFFITKNSTVDCQMMHMSRDLKYGIDNHLNAKILELPYNNGNVSMIVILPNSMDGISELEEKLKDADLTSLTQELRYDEVQLSLPKFKIETTIDLKPILKEMGLDIIFDPKRADFSELAESDEQLYVSEAIQKAFIEVNEEGAEAAAATALTIVLECYKEPIIFEANHPFIIYFYCHLSQHNTIFFGGKVSNPIN